MADTEWPFPARSRPQAEKLRFDLAAALRSVVLVHAEVPEEAFTAEALGTERIGHGILIEPGNVVLTIGYLIVEATTIWLTAADGSVVPGHTLAYDQVTGFGLIMPLGRLEGPTLPRGSAESLAPGDPVLVAGHGTPDQTLAAKVTSRREFAGDWEYLLDHAIFSTPAHLQWGGAALLGEEGHLLGVGSLLVQDTRDNEIVAANMFVPIDLIEPILDDMLKLGRPSRPARPWLGLYATPMKGHLVVGGLAQGGPAQKAGVQLGDVVVEIGGQPVTDLADLLRRVWSQGPAGTQIPLTLMRETGTSLVRVTSADREDFLLKPRRH
jgi:S1-C subfamily serine protease